MAAIKAVAVCVLGLGVALICRKFEIFDGLSVVLRDAVAFGEAGGLTILSFGVTGISNHFVFFGNGRAFGLTFGTEDQSTKD